MLRGLKVVTLRISVFSPAGNCFVGFGGETIFRHVSRVRNQNLKPSTTVLDKIWSKKTSKKHVHFQSPRGAQKCPPHSFWYGRPSQNHFIFIRTTEEVFLFPKKLQKQASQLTQQTHNKKNPGRHNEATNVTEIRKYYQF